MKKILALLLVMIASFTLSGCAIIDYLTEPEETQLKLMDARAIGREATLGIKVEKSNHAFSQSTASGSGFVFAQSAEDYYLLTNFHVIDPEDANDVIYMVLNLDVEDVEAQLIYVSSEKDLAILSVSKDDITLTPLDIETRRDTQLQRQEMLISIGYPSDLKGLVTYGEYLGMGQTDKVEFDVIAHSALIYPGNSGGPLLDLDGNVVGINTWSSSSNIERYMAIPIDIVHEFLDEWKATHDSIAQS